MAGLPERLAPYNIEGLKPSGEWHDTQPANWKIVIDNYNEGYHVPIAHPGLMRLLDYKRYDVEVHDGWVWFEAPMRDKPSGNPLERAYQRLVTPMPGLGENDRRVWRYAMIYPNTTIDLYPDQVATWRIDPDGPLRSRDHARTYRHPRAGRADPARAVRQQPAEHAGRQGGPRPGGERAGRPRDARLRARAAVPARGGDRVVRRAHPRRPRVTGVAATERGARERILAAAVERIARDGIDEVRIARIAMDAGVSSSLVHYHFETREALLEQALDYSYELAGDVRLAPRATPSSSAASGGWPR